MTPPTTPPTTDPPPPPAPGEAPPRPRLTRRTEGHLLGGVAGGIADHLGIDPVLVRVAFVVLALWPFPGFGLLVYLALVLVVPPAEASAVPRAPRRGTERGGAFYVGVALLVVALLALLGIGSAVAPIGGGVLVPLALIGIGVALWVSSDRDRARPVPSSGAAWWQDPAPPGAAAEGDDATPSPAATTEGPRADTAPAPAPAVPTGTPTGPGEPTTPAWGGSPPGDRPTTTTGPVWQAPPPPPRSPLGRLTLGLALTVTAVLWALDLAGALDVTATQLLAAPLAVLGLGLLVGAVVGRARWLAWIAAPLALALVAAAVVEDADLPFDAGFADRTVLIGAGGAGTGDDHRAAAGSLRLDLTQAEPATLDGRALTAEVGAGELVVLLPPGVAVTGVARVEVGELRVRSDEVWFDRGGLGVEQPLALTDGAPVATVDVDLRVGAGVLRVEVVPVDPEADPSEGAPSEDAEASSEEPFEEDVVGDDEAALHEELPTTRTLATTSGGAR